MEAKKSLGQNFLIDKNIIAKIITSINASTNDLIIEIGPGRGALTKELKKFGSQILAYEVDTDLKKYLIPLLDNNLKIIYKDILTTDIKGDIKNYNYDNLIIVGNLPYYITTPIIKHLISENLNISRMYFMVQEEVADRFSAAAGSKDYGSITLYLKYYFNVKKLFKVHRTSFNPAPKVESAILEFIKREDKPDVVEDSYLKLINESFKFKRKTLKNNLSSKYDWLKIKEVLNTLGYKDTVRAEELTEEDFIKIWDILN